MSLIRKRPRDLIKLLTLAAKKTRSRRAHLIATDDFKDCFDEYSQGRITDTENEYKSELPDISRLLFGMKPSKRERSASLGYTYSTTALLKKMADIQEQGAFRLANGKQADDRDLAAFLYKINFITARKQTPQGIVRRYFEENRYLSSALVDFGFDWEVHPAYRWALQPERIEDIYLELELSVEEPTVTHQRSGNPPA